MPVVLQDTLLNEHSWTFSGSPLTEALALVRVRARQQLVSAVAVSVAVRISPRLQKAGRDSRLWLGILKSPANDQL